MKWLWPVLLACCMIGCSQSTPPEQSSKADPVAENPDKPESPVDKRDELFEKISSGTFAVNAAVAKISKGTDVVNSMLKLAKGEDVEPLKDMLATLEDAGASLADYGGETPSEETVVADRQKFEARRNNLINELNDILKDMREQSGVAASLAEIGPPELIKPAHELDGLLNEIIDDIIGAITEAGGKVEGEASVPDTGDTNQPVPGGYTTGR